MNQQEVEKFFHEARAVELRNDAKRSGREMLMQRMSFDVPIKPKTRFVWLAQSWVRAGGFASLLLLVGSTAWAAEAALPGDTLYSWKTGINEPVRLAILPTPVARAEWSAELFARRLDEAETLASKGALNNETQHFLEEKLNQERERADAFGRSVGEVEAGRIETEMQERSERGTHIEVRERDGRLRIRVREEHEERESDEEKRRENEIRHEDGWIEETELHEDDHGEDVREKEDEKTVATPSVAPKTAPKKAATTGSEDRNNKDSMTSSSGSNSTKTSENVESSEDDKNTDTRQSLISESAARSKALSAVPGTVKESELKDEEDDPVWEVEIRRSSDNEDVKVVIDAESGGVKEIKD